jgi:hypothetical protein
VSLHVNGVQENEFFHGVADTKGPLKGVPYDTRDPKFSDFYHERTPDGRKILPSFGEKFLKRHLDLIDQYKPDLLYFDGGLPYGESGLKVGAHLLNVSVAENGKKQNGVLYVIPLAWPEGRVLTIRSLGSREPALGVIKSIQLIGLDSDLNWSRADEGLRIEIPEMHPATSPRSSRSATEQKAGQCNGTAFFKAYASELRRLRFFL